jgi:hypothetical protein
LLAEVLAQRKMHNSLYRIKADKISTKDGMERVVCVSHARVPIVKIWDPQLKMACDMNVNNTLALENTRMIRTYVDMDERVRPLAMIIKHWTKQRVLNDAGQCMGLMVFFVYFLADCFESFSTRWYIELLHMDMLDYQLSPDSRTSHPTKPSTAAAQSSESDRWCSSIV